MKHLMCVPGLLAISVVCATSSFNAKAATVADQAFIRKARQISARLTGIPFAIGDARLDQMIAQLKLGKPEEAARIAANDPGFVNNTLRMFAAPIHTENQTYREVGLTESMAYIIGVIRDRRDINLILTGQDFYRVTNGTCAADANPYKCMDDRGLRDLSTNGNLDDGATQQTPVVSQNVRVNNMGVPYNGELRLADGRNSGDRSGIFTMHGFGNAAFRAGTNRRGIQQMVNQLWCLPLNAIRTSDVLDTYVGPDISRDPDGNGLATYRAQCRTCHSIIDGMRSAFVHMDQNGDGQLEFKTNGVVSKYTRASENYPMGYLPKTNSWQVMFNPSQLAQFGWTGATVGTGIRSLAEAFGQSEQFYSCMVQKVTEVVCPTDPNATEAGLQQMLSSTVKAQLAKDLRTNRDLRRTFELVAARPECLGK